MNLDSLPPRARSWNLALAASPGALDLTIPARDIDGVVPPALRGGRVLSNGPGWNRIGDRTVHPFDGHGYVRSFELQEDGSCRLRAEFVRTPSYLAEAAAGRMVHRGFATNVSNRFWENIAFGTPRNVANTTILRWGDRLLAGWEAGAPYGMDAGSLQTRGEEHFGGVIEGVATLAHMRKDHRLGRLVLCSIKNGRNTTFTFRELDSEDRVVATCVAEVPGMVFTHDYALSPSWFVLGGNPLRLRPGRLVKTLLGADTLLRSVRTDDRRPGALHLVPRDGGAVRTVELPGPAYVVHFGNAFERDGDLIVDLCAFSSFDFGEEFGYTGPDTPFDPTLPEARGPQRLLRVTVPPEGPARWEQRVPHGVDFPRFHPEHEGVETPLLFGATRKDPRCSDPFDSVLAVDLLDPERPPTLWTTPEHVFVGEPLFAPDPEHPDRGHLCAILSDGLGGRTTLAIFDAAAVDRGPVASIPCPLLPVAFHGDWDPVGAA